jgi:predicted phage-related endonuclease
LSKVFCFSLSWKMDIFLALQHNIPVKHKNPHEINKKLIKSFITSTYILWDQFKRDLLKKLLNMILQITYSKQNHLCIYNASPALHFSKPNLWKAQNVFQSGIHLTVNVSLFQKTLVNQESNLYSHLENSLISAYVTDAMCYKNSTAADISWVSATSDIYCCWLTLY